MNGRYSTSFDMEPFPTSYQVTGGCVSQSQQQQYGPCMEDYDPARLMDPISIPTYNPTQSRTSNSAHHRTVMPSSSAYHHDSSSAISQQQQQHQQHRQQQPQQQQQRQQLQDSQREQQRRQLQQLQQGVVARAPGMSAMGDLEPIPISKAAMQRINQSFTFVGGMAMRPMMDDDAMGQAQLAFIKGMLSENKGCGKFSQSQQQTSNQLHQKQQQQKQQKQQQQQTEAKPKPREACDQCLEDLKVEVPGISLEPVIGTDIISRLESKAQDVVKRYLPCVDFLVGCQQDLRKGLAAATQKRLVHHMFRDAMTPRQFHNAYIAPLPERFYRKNHRLMEPKALDDAVKDLSKLCSEAKAVEQQGCEVVKNTFLGGMKDGESWGLRKWLSKNGGALHICNDCECILHACQKLDRSLDTTRKLGEKLRPLAKRALIRLKADVPSSYQEVSTAHPYLPFFHRLESALKGMSNFDPEDDDVICIDDDDEIKMEKAKATPAKSRKRRRKEIVNEVETAAKRIAASLRANSAVDSDDDSIIEIINVKPSTSGDESSKNSLAGSDAGDLHKTTLDFNILETFDDDSETSPQESELEQKLQLVMSPSGLRNSAVILSEGLERLACIFDSNMQDSVRPTHVNAVEFWDSKERYANALRLFSDIIRSPDSSCYLERVNEKDLIQEGNPPYSKVIKHPLCFRDIVAALLNNIRSNSDCRQPSASDGELPDGSLSCWNMWRGIDLLQAIDLVFLNSLAYARAADAQTSNDRSITNRLRKVFWAGIKKEIDRCGTRDTERRKLYTPTKRGEASGFVVFKNR